MDYLLQQLVNALSLGGIYALLAIGLAVVFSIVNMVNFAHGEIMTAAGYALFFTLVSTGSPLMVAIAAAMVAGAAVAVGAERFAFRPMRKADATSLLITSFAVSMILRVVFQNGVSARPQPVPLPEYLSGSIVIGPVYLAIIPLISFLVTLVSLAALSLFLRRTVLGTAMRAAAGDFEVVRLMGIRADRVVAVAFAVSGTLAAIAAILWIAQRGSVDPLMGAVPVLKAFVAAIIGGLGSLFGAVAGGFLLGVLEVACQAYLPPDILPYRDAVVLALVIAVLLVRPDGLFPAATGRRS